MNERAPRFVGPYAIGSAAVSVVLAPLTALAYFATADGAEELEAGSVAAWAEPAREAVGVLVTFASPDRVYSTYTQFLALAVPALFLTAYVARRKRRGASRRLERWGWRTALTGYALFAAGLLILAVLLVPGDPSAGAVDPVFLAMMVPGLLTALIGSTMLGIALLRDGYRPRATAWLLTGAFPLWVVGSVVLGHNSIGLVPLLLAWGTTAWSWGPEGAGDIGIPPSGEAPAPKRDPLAGTPRAG